jgi:hypothetical protein
MIVLDRLPTLLFRGFSSDGGISVMPTYSLKFYVPLSAPALSRALTHSGNQGLGDHTGPHS